MRKSMWRSGWITVLAAALSPVGCATNCADGAGGSAAALEIAAIHWSSSNPSLGPHERTARASVSPESFESPEAWRVAVAALLDETRVNEAASLRAYLRARRDRDAMRLATVEAADTRDLDAGGGYASVAFTIATGETIEIANLKRTRLTGHWPRFWETHLRDRIEEEVTRPPLDATEPR